MRSINDITITFRVSAKVGKQRFDATGRIEEELRDLRKVKVSNWKTLIESKRRTG